MKLNQFARLQPDFKTQIKELFDIGFLPTDYQHIAPKMLHAILFGNLFPDCLTLHTKKEAFQNFMISSEMTLDQYLATQPTLINTKYFYNFALQKLGFEVDQDFNLSTPKTFMTTAKLPFVEFDTLDQSQLISAFYLLLNTRGKNGLLLIDQLANEGFYLNWQKNHQQPQHLFFNGKAQPVFSTHSFIKEVVYVQSDLDTDQDGQYDLLETIVIRPVETNHNLKVPAIYTASPYFKGINDVSSLMHSVDLAICEKPISKESITPLNKSTASPITADGQITKGDSSTSEKIATDASAYSLNDYFLVRGFAVVYAGGIGTRGSDGIRYCGAVEETSSTTAIIEWLNGSRQAFTNKSNGIQIKAWWCNQNIAMTGKSYLGTLANAAATTGVKGLKTIIAEAAISSWYDYYRENGLVVAPIDCQGEDADVLAGLCQTNQKDSGNYAKLDEIFKQQLALLKHGQDRTTGNYNQFWDNRNYRHHIDQIKCDVLLVHGLNDWNVKMQNVGAMWESIQALPIHKKIILHQGEHVYINHLQSLDFTDMMNLWLSYQLLDVDNHAPEKLPDILIQANETPQTWRTPDSWLTSEPSEQKLYFNKNILTPLQVRSRIITSFTDNGVKTFHDKVYTEHQWQEAFINQQADFSENQFRAILPNLDNALTITGRATLNLAVSVNQDHGLISAMLVDFGLFNRLNANATTLINKGQQLGYQWHCEDTKDFLMAPEKTPYQIISKAHINLQNRTNSWTSESVEPGQFYQITLPMQPTYYTLKPGHQLGIIIYATDMAMTLRQIQNNQYQLDLANCNLVLPVVQ